MAPVPADRTVFVVRYAAPPIDVRTVAAILPSGRGLQLFSNLVLDETRQGGPIGVGGGFPTDRADFAVIHGIPVVEKPMLIRVCRGCVTVCLIGVAPQSAVIICLLFSGP